jgi:hypothetical protein
MLSVQEEAVAGAPTWRRYLELRTTAVAGGREFLQTQLLSADFVLTRIGHGTILFLRDGCRRYAVDREQRVLRPIAVGGVRSIDPSSPRPTRTTVALHDGPVDVDGYACRRLTVESRVGQVVLSTESYYAQLPGVERTALHAERLVGAPAAYPAHLLQPDEVLILATTVVRQGDFEQTQTSRLRSVRADPEEAELDVELLTYPRAGARA